MKFFMKLERKLGKYAINNLMMYLVAFYGIGALISLVKGPLFYYNYFSLNFDLIFRGEVWRLLTFLMYPIGNNYFMMFISLYIYYILGNMLERIWGSFKFNFFIFSGIIMIVLAGAIARYVFLMPMGMPAFSLGNTYLNLSIFLLFALINPEQVFLFFFILPVKAKYIALIDLLYFGIAIYGGGGSRVEAIAVLANVVLILWIIGALKFSNLVHKKKPRYYTKARRTAGSTEFENIRKESRDIPIHRCSVCGITEKQDPNMEFRYCSKCNGMFEYCMDHIHNHEHKQ